MKYFSKVIVFTVVLVLVFFSRVESRRSRRSIREWFSGMFDRFKPKKAQPYYLSQSYVPYYPQATSYGYNPPSHYGAPQHNTHQSSYGGSAGYSHHGGGHSSQHVAPHLSNAGHNSFQGGGGHDYKTQDLGFGPVKGSDVINHGGGNIHHSHHHEHYSNLNHIDSGSLHSSSHDGSGKHHHSSFTDVHDDSHNPGYSGRTPSKHKPTIVEVPHDAKSDEVYGGPADNFISNHNIVQHSVPFTGSHPIDVRGNSHHHHNKNNRDQVESQSQSNPYSPVVFNSNDIHIQTHPGQTIYTPQLGPNEPIIEIVFQDRKPSHPPPPPPVIDESLYSPVGSDDVEVFFIEYSPEDNIHDINSLDLSKAQPAILQDLPNELPSDIKSHLLRSGVLENAEIEIIDLDKALSNNNLDSHTRNVLQQAYTRAYRDTAPKEVVKDSNQAVDVRVKRLKHDSSSPEGIAEFLSGLKTFRKGKFAGVVEVNDKKTDKFIPVTVDGGKLPLPDSIPLEDKKVDGVLVLAPDSDNTKKREAKSSFGPLPIPAALTAPFPSPVKNEHRRLLDLNWADMDTNGWIPVISSDI